MTFLAYFMSFIYMLSLCSYVSTRYNESIALEDFFREANFTLKQKNKNFCLMTEIICVNFSVISIMMENHNLNGQISPSLGNLHNLRSIRLDGNKLHGTLPSSLSRLRNLLFLNWTGNHLSPPYPSFKESILVIPKLPSTPTPHHMNPSPLNPTPSALPPSKLIPPPKLSPIVSPTAPLLPSKYSNNYRIIILGTFFGFQFIISLVICVWWWRSLRRPSNRHQGGINMFLHTFEDATDGFAPQNIIGKGRTAFVYRGQRQDGSLMAIKKLHASSYSENESVFIAELNVLSQAQHPNVVKMLGYYREGEDMILALEHLSKGSLSDHLFQREELKLEPLTWNRRLRIALDIAKGIEYLHSLRPLFIVHGDLKSGNILIDDDFHAKISDFGLSEFVPGERASVSVHTIVGSTGYMAPEFEETRRYNPKVDIFSFGVILMELVTGKRAYDPERSTRTRYLVPFLRGIISTKRRSVLDLVDRSMNLGNHTLAILAVVDLAMICTDDNSDERPSMSVVVSTLAPLQYIPLAM